MRGKPSRLGAGVLFPSGMAVPSLLDMPFSSLSGMAFSFPSACDSFFSFGYGGLLAASSLWDMTCISLSGMEVSFPLNITGFLSLLYMAISARSGVALVWVWQDLGFPLSSVSFSSYLVSCQRATGNGNRVGL